MIPRPAPAPVPPLPPVGLPRLLLVEGDTPVHFFEAFLRHLGIAHAVEVRNFRSVASLKPYLQDLASTVEFQAAVQSLGVVRDAELDANGARQSVEGALQAAGLTPGRVPPIRTAIFILPDNTSTGMLETLCLRAVAGETALQAATGCIAEFFTCLTKNNVSLPLGPKLAKNQAQAYLATRLDAQLFPGQAAYRGYWPWDNVAFDALRQFLLAL